MGEVSLDELALNYGSLSGSSSLRQAIVTFHQELNKQDNNCSDDCWGGVELNEKNVLTFCGAQEALAAAYEALLLLGDEVIVITPCYPSLVNMTKQRGCIVKEVKLLVEHRWKLTIECFLSLVNNKTKLIVLNSPHNPTGAS